jgi:arabinogalactan endo-1,4-beta-galactosidase
MASNTTPDRLTRDVFEALGPAVTVANETGQTVVLASERQGAFNGITFELEAGRSAIFFVHEGDRIAIRLAEPRP